MSFHAGANQLEAWLGEHEHTAEHLLAHSGVDAAPPDLVPVPESVQTGYGEVPQDPRLAEAVAARYDVPPEEVLVTVGASEADLLAFLSLLDPGDRVLVGSPTYPPLRDVPAALGAEVVDLPRDPRDGFRLDVDRVEGELAEGARLVVVVDPHNPSGTTLGEAGLRDLADRCMDHDAWLLVDEVFHELSPQPRASARSLHPRILSTHSLTKCHGLAGLRTGWLLAPPEVMADAREGKASTTLGNPPVTQEVARRVVQDPAPFLDRALGLREANLPRLREAVEDLGLRWVDPTAGVSSAVAVPGDGDDVAFAKHLLADRDVLVVPGSFLGSPGWLRVGFGTDPAAFEAALEGFVSFSNQHV